MDIRITGLDQLRRQLDSFSDRRFNAAIATALTRAGKAAQEELRRDIMATFDKPTPFTLNALRLWPAKADKLEARVGFRDDYTGGSNANNYLMPHVEGGTRVLKRLERQLQSAGALPGGWYAVPGQGAAIDSYGNPSRGQVQQILSQLRIRDIAGADNAMAAGKKGIAAQRRAGGRFFVMPVGSKVQPGIYQREMFGRNITPVYIFVSGVQYRKRWDFWNRAKAIAERELPKEITRSVQEHIAKLAKQGRA
jgi:hypothetical protein